MIQVYNLACILIMILGIILEDALRVPAIIRNTNIEGQLWRLSGYASHMTWRTLRAPSTALLKVSSFVTSFIFISLKCHHFEQRALDAYIKALEYKVNSGNPDILLELGEVYYDYGAYDGALKLLSQIIVDYPSFKDLSQCIFLCAIMLSYLNDLPQAIAYAQYVRDDNPMNYNDFEYSFVLARLYERDPRHYSKDDISVAYMNSYKLIFPNRKPSQWKVREIEKDYIVYILIY